jgi:hypothetical protein
MILITKKIIFISLINLFIFNCFAQKKNVYLVFDNDAPDTNPKVNASRFFNRDSSIPNFPSILVDRKIDQHLHNNKS